MPHLVFNTPVLCRSFGACLLARLPVAARYQGQSTPRVRVALALDCIIVTMVEASAFILTVLFLTLPCFFWVVVVFWEPIIRRHC
jgi:hypothetical protein